MPRLATILIVLAPALIPVGCGGDSGPPKATVVAGKNDSVGEAELEVEGKATVVGQIVHDFGTAYPFVQGRHVFRIRNDGESTLILTKGAVSCGCTGHDLSDGELAPGKVGKVLVRWKTKAEPVFSESVLVHTSDPANQTIRLVVRGSVIVPYYVKPNHLDFGTVPKTQEATQSLKLWTQRFPDLRIERIDVDPQRFSVTTAKLSPDQLPGGPGSMGYRIDVTLRPGAPSGPLQERMVVTTNHKGRPTIEVKLAADIRGQVSADRPVVDFQQVQPGRGKTRTLFVYMESNAALTLKMDAHEPAFLKVKIVRLKNMAASHRIEVTVPPGSPAGEFIGHIRFKTDNADTPVLSIEVRGIVLFPRSGS